MDGNAVNRSIVASDFGRSDVIERTFDEGPRLRSA